MYKAIILSCENVSWIVSFSNEKSSADQKKSPLRVPSSDFIIENNCNRCNNISRRSLFNPTHTPYAHAFEAFESTTWFTAASGMWRVALCLIVNTDSGAPLSLVFSAFEWSMTLHIWMEEVCPLLLIIKLLMMEKYNLYSLVFLCESNRQRNTQRPLDDV